MDAAADLNGGAETRDLPGKATGRDSSNDVESRTAGRRHAGRRIDADATVECDERIVGSNGIESGDGKGKKQALHG